MGSILTDVKKVIGLDSEYDAFDTDIILHINSAFATLTQLGCGPEEGFLIEGNLETWDDFEEDSSIAMSFVKNYVYLKTRLGFDPPANSSILKAMEDQIKEIEWRINVQVDPKEDD